MSNPRLEDKKQEMGKTTDAQVISHQSEISANSKPRFALGLEEEKANVIVQQGPTCGPAVLANMLARLDGGLKRFGFSDDAKNSTESTGQILTTLYDSVYNSTEELNIRKGNKITVDQTTGVHPTALAEMATKLGLEVELHDEDFDSWSAGYKTREKDIEHNNKRLAEIKNTTSDEKRLECISGLRTKLVNALNDGNMVGIRGTYGNWPALAHWWLAAGWDPKKNSSLILINPRGSHYTRSIKPEQLKASLPGRNQVPTDKLKELSKTDDELLPHLTSLLIFKDRKNVSNALPVNDGKNTKSECNESPLRV